MKCIVIAWAARLTAALLPLVLFPAALPIGASAQSVQPAERLLLAFKALPPHEKRERNLYELAERVTGFIDGRRFPPAAVITEGNVRYGVYAVRRARVVRTTDSRRSPSSSRSGLRYLLEYNTLYKLCALEYRIGMESSRSGTITYVDCESGQTYSFPVSTGRPFDIFELDVIAGDVFEQLWNQRAASPGAAR